MIHPGSTRDTQTDSAQLDTRAGLSRLMRRVCSGIGIDHYLLVEPAAERGLKGLRILASNWIYDALEELGGEGIFSLIESGHAARLGETVAALPASAAFLSPQQRLALRDHGHDQIFIRRLCVRGRSIFALLSAARGAGIAPAALARAGVMCSYALDGHLAAAAQEPSRAGILSERQRECLKWVSEGKTTEEIALILGVSSNTINSYVAHAIQKFGASNRAMAIATAIRSGVI